MSSFFSFLEQNLSSVLFIFICNAILLFFWNYFSYFYDSIPWFLEKLTKSLLSTILLELLCLHLAFLLFPSNLARTLLLLLVGLSAIALIVEGFLLYSYRSLITPYVLDAILQTNFKEAREFFIAFLNLKIFLIALGFLLAGYGYFKFFPNPTNNPVS